MTQFTKLHGWGMNPNCLTRLVSPANLQHLQELIMNGSARGILATGLQRSYGDSTLNSGGITVSTSAFKACTIDEVTGVVIADAGLSIQELEYSALAKDLFPPIVPGTGFVTLGGAIAADIHGKSHHLTGSFSSVVRRLKVLHSDGNIRDLYPTGQTAKYYWATVGGLGLTGIIIEVELQLMKVSNNLVEVAEVRCSNLDSLMSELKSADEQYSHTAAWIDLSGSFRGRGIVSKANYSRETTKSLISNADKYSPSFPSVFGKNLINKTTIKSFNEFWFRKPLTNRNVPLNKYMHPLDRIRNWNRIYGADGFLQYQFVVPDSEHGLIIRMLDELKKIDASSFLAVLKRFGVGNQAPLSFPMEGWTLAMDFPAKLPGLESLLNTFDEWVTEAGGRIYLIKDSRMRPEHIESMYPDSEKWKEVRNEMDPIHLWKSDQSRRLDLC